METDFINLNEAIDNLCESCFLSSCSHDCDAVKAIRGTKPADVVPQENYNRLLKVARAMHTWIFLNTGDEQKAYDECGLTDEENILFGYVGQFELQEDGGKTSV